MIVASSWPAAPDLFVLEHHTVPTGCPAQRHRTHTADCAKFIWRRCGSVSKQLFQS